MSSPPPTVGSRRKPCIAPRCTPPWSGKIQGLTSGRRLGDEDAVEMIGRGEALRSCPLPLRETAARRCNSHNGVRGRAAGPHPAALADAPALPSPAREEGVPARLLALLLLLSLAAAPARAADDVENFYRGKQIRFIVGSAPGGTYDLLARIVARHIGTHIPGSPNIIVQNQPTAGGLLMVNQLYTLGPNDGTAIGVPLN